MNMAKTDVKTAAKEETATAGTNGSASKANNEAITAEITIAEKQM